MRRLSASRANQRGRRRGTRKLLNAGATTAGSTPALARSMRTRVLPGPSPVANSAGNACSLLQPTSLADRLGPWPPTGRTGCADRVPLAWVCSGRASRYRSRASAREPSRGCRTSYNRFPRTGRSSARRVLRRLPTRDADRWCCARSAIPGGRSRNVNRVRGPGHNLPKQTRPVRVRAPPDNHVERRGRDGLRPGRKCQRPAGGASGTRRVGRTRSHPPPGALA